MHACSSVCVELLQYQFYGEKRAKFVMNCSKKCIIYPVTVCIFQTEYEFVNIKIISEFLDIFLSQKTTQASFENRTRQSC